MTVGEARARDMKEARAPRYIKQVSNPLLYRRDLDATSRYPGLIALLPAHLRGTHQLGQIPAQDALRKSGDKGTASMLPHQQALLGKQRERLPQGGTAHPQLLGKLGFSGETLAGYQFAAHDGLTQRIGHQVGERQTSNT